MRYFVHLAYKGTRFRGWQRQKQTPETIQQILEAHFSQMFKEKITIFGCGRTDAGVHASQYFLHFNYSETIDYDPVDRMNKMLPEDIRILEFIEMHNSAHSQYDAESRTYKYYLHFNENPFKSDLSVYANSDELDFEKLSKAVELIAKQSDFRSMCKKPSQYKHTRCDLKKFEVNRQLDGLCFTIQSNRFLQSMVRLLIGNVLDVAKGKMSLKALNTCFETGQPPQFHNAAYPQGLFLAEIKYPYLNRTPL